MKSVLTMLAVALAGVAFGAQAHAVPANAQTAPFAACGTLVEAVAGGGDPRYFLSIRTTALVLMKLRLAPPGTAPDNLPNMLNARSAEKVSVVGTVGATNSATPDRTTVVNYTVTPVASCTMPNTSTNADSAPTRVRALPNTSTSP